MAARNRRYRPGGNGLPAAPMPPLSHRGQGGQVATPGARPPLHRPAGYGPDPRLGGNPYARPAAPARPAPQPAVAPQPFAAPAAGAGQPASPYAPQTVAPAAAGGYQPPNTGVPDLGGMDAGQVIQQLLQGGPGALPGGIAPEALQHLLNSPEAALVMQRLSDMERQQLMNMTSEQRVGRLEAAGQFARGKTGVPEGYWRGRRAMDEKRLVGERDEALKRANEMAVAGGYANTARARQMMDEIRRNYTSDLSDARIKMNTSEADMLREDRWRQAGVEMQTGASVSNVLGQREFGAEDWLGARDYLESAQDSQGVDPQQIARTQAMLNRSGKYVEPTDGGTLNRFQRQANEAGGLGSPLQVDPTTGAAFLPGRSRVPIDQRVGWGNAPAEQFFGGDQRGTGIREGKYKKVMGKVADFIRREGYSDWGSMSNEARAKMLGKLPPRIQSRLPRALKRYLTGARRAADPAGEMNI